MSMSEANPRSDTLPIDDRKWIVQLQTKILVRITREPRQNAPTEELLSFEADWLPAIERLAPKGELNADCQEVFDTHRKEFEEKVIQIKKEKPEFVDR